MSLYHRNFVHKSILITGAAGFIGSHLAHKLIMDGYTVHVLVKPDTNLWRLSDIRHHITVHTIELTSQSSLVRLLRKLQPHAIYHSAAYGNYAHQRDAHTMVSVNINGTLSLLEASLRNPYTIFVHIGSSAEYGSKDTKRKETDFLEPVSIHAATKASATLLCLSFAKTYRKPIVTLRPFTVYGPKEEPFRFIPTVIHSLLSGSPLKLPKDPIRHDYIYIDDMVDACVRAMTFAQKLQERIINIGSGQEYTNSEVVRLLGSIAKRKARIKYGGYAARSWDSRHWVADISLARTLLSWNPRMFLREGLRLTYQWYYSNYRKKNQ